MFDIGWGELLVIGVVALIAIGPKELPGVLRSVGHWMGKIRRMASEFQGQFQEAMREAEMADLKKEVESIGNTARDLGASVQEATRFDDPTQPAPTAAPAAAATIEAGPPPLLASTGEASPPAPPAPAVPATDPAPASPAPAQQPARGSGSAMPTLEPQLPLPEPAPPVNANDFAAAAPAPTYAPAPAAPPKGEGA
jgi:sec-independent protein translocase protein TatB